MLGKCSFRLTWPTRCRVCAVELLCVLQGWVFQNDLDSCAAYVRANYLVIIAALECFLPTSIPLNNHQIMCAYEAAFCTLNLLLHLKRFDCQDEIHRLFPSVCVCVCVASTCEATPYSPA
jgi:hypothetical protein